MAVATVATVATAVTATRKRTIEDVEEAEAVTAEVDADATRTMTIRTVPVKADEGAPDDDVGVGDPSKPCAQELLLDVVLDVYARCCTLDCMPVKLLGPQAAAI